jgi:hypothetical protein
MSGAGDSRDVPRINRTGTMDETSLFPDFEPVRNGVFLQRYGRGHGPNIPHTQKKLCFVATDQHVLSELLLELSYRDDCYMVKFSMEPKDGMYLGRCFLTEESHVGPLWHEFKAHPRVMCTVQDDDFVLPYRFLDGP